MRIRGRPKFLVDGMLGTLARKLRIYGFDTAYVQGLPDDEMLIRARRETRILLTADEALYARALSHIVPALCVTGKSDAERLARIFGEVRLDVRLHHAFSRCPVCNGHVAEIRRSTVNALVPVAVASRHRRFYRCQDCGKVYWSGSHWRRLRTLTSRVKQRLIRAQVGEAAAPVTGRG